MAKFDVAPIVIRYRVTGSKLSGFNISVIFISSNWRIGLGAIYVQPPLFIWLLGINARVNCEQPNMIFLRQLVESYL